MDLLLITGAGAGRNLAREDGPPLPLMGDWANALCTALDEQMPNFASACGLSTGMAPDKFEEAVGQLLEYRTMQPMIDRFLTFGGPNPGEVHGDVQGWRQRTTERLQHFESALNVTLYEQFGQSRIDENKAVEAYRLLFEQTERTSTRCGDHQLRPLRRGRAWRAWVHRRRRVHAGVRRARSGPRPTQNP